MKTRILLAPLLGAVLALVPGPAQAKGVEDATVTGPGLEQPLEFETQEAGNELAQKTALYDGLFGSCIDSSPCSTTETLGESAPPGDLGPRYVAEYRLAGDGSAEVRQELYPFATGGAVT